MRKKEIIYLAIKYVLDYVSEKECITILNLSPEEMDIFCEVVKALTVKKT